MKNKIAIYSCRDFDEKHLFLKYEKEYNLELVLCQDPPNMDNIEIARDCACVNVLTSKVTQPMLEAFSELGVSYLTTRTIGYDHIDLQAAQEYGITIANAPYGPNGVAEYTVMLLLMAIRKMKGILQRGAIQDYTLKGLQGKELKDLCVGIVGTGRIGMTVAQNLSGFGCKILAYDVVQNEAAKQWVKYVSLDELWEASDIISLHTPLTEDSYHMVNKKTISQMKDGVIIINTARGSLINSVDLIEALEIGKVGAAALDVVEDEFSLYYYDRKSDVLSNQQLAILRAMPNVIISHHMAFYTDNCVETVIRDSLKGCLLHIEKKENPWEVQ